MVGHGLAAVSDRKETVENDDYATFTAFFGETRGSLEVSRVAAGYPNGLDFEVFCENGAASFPHRSACTSTATTPAETATAP